MSTFKEIRGTLIKSVSSDPANPEVGEIWYNSTIGSLKAYRTINAAWASGGNLPTAKQALSGFGTQTAAVGAAGYTTTSVNTSEEYNGSSWTASGNLTNSKTGIATCKETTEVIKKNIKIFLIY